MVYGQGLNNLLDTVNELTENSISFWHQALVKEIQASVDEIARLMSDTNPKSLVKEIAQILNQQELYILEAVKPLLTSLRELVESGNLTESESTQLLIQLGTTHDILAQWDSALDRFYRALDYCQDSLEERAEVLKYIGHIKSKQGDYRAAQSQYRKSLADYTELQKRSEVAYIYLCLGFNDFESDDYQSAEENYRIALSTANSIANAEQIIGEINLTLGILATVKGNFQDALSHYKQSLQSFESIGDERGFSQVYYNMGLLHVDMRQFADAGECYQRCLGYARQHNDLHLIGLIHLSWTELALKLSEFTLAQAYCMQAFRIFGRLGCQPQLAEAYKYAGQIQFRKGIQDKAERFFQKSIALGSECNSRLNQAQTHYEYGLMLIDKPDYDTARVQLNTALNIFTELTAQADIQKTQTALERLAESETNVQAKPRRRFKRIR